MGIQKKIAVGVACPFGIVFGWLAIFALFGYKFDPWALLAAMLAACIMAFAILYRPMKSEQLIPIRSFLISFSCVAVLAGCIHAWPPRPTGFAFLGGRPPAFVLNIGTGDVVGNTYTFPGDFDQMAKQIENELAPLGFKAGHHLESFSMRLPNSRSDESLQLYLMQGKATGKTRFIDADNSEVEKVPGWVTVEIWEPNPTPEWVRALRGSRE